ncbi:MAG TPA: hypothetical protein H9819_04825 [Candidatus Bacteroides merdipullorum]|uniref:Uncharacterized protein n=1 Tax=Candidatus Bacteroides merdipullorum TaxID=2838474 RepID=A0A9D2A5I1_9BACE|nr:hypothetical protein [Candidatus Bacteroides merdipullorum]
MNKRKEEAPEAFPPYGQERSFFRTRSLLLSDEDAFFLGDGKIFTSGGSCFKRQMLFFPSVDEPFPVFFVFSEDTPVRIRYFVV